MFLWCSIWSLPTRAFHKQQQPACCFVMIIINVDTHTFSPQEAKNITVKVVFLLSSPFSCKVMIIDDVITAGTPFEKSHGHNPASWCAACWCAFLPKIRQATRQGELSCFKSETRFKYPVISIVSLNDIMTLARNRILLSLQNILVREAYPRPIRHLMLSSKVWGFSSKP